MGSLPTAVGFLLLALVGVVYLVSGLVVPAPWVGVLWVVWACLVAVAVARRRSPKVVLATPFVGVAVWIAVVAGGGALWGWTA